MAKSRDRSDTDDLYFLWIFSAVFLVVPYTMQCVVCLRTTMKWHRMRKDNPVRIHEYLKDYQLLIYGLTIISGFYGTIALLQSKFLYFEFFWIPLKKSELKPLKT